MSDVAAEIKAAEDTRYAAMIGKDLAGLDDLFLEDAIYTHSTGTVDTKASYIAGIESEKWRYQKVDRIEESVRRYGDTAVLNGHVQLQVQVGDRELALDAAVTVIYVLTDGAWKFAGWHSSPKA